MRDFLSERVKNIKPSGIRKFFDLASTQKGVISLGVGEPDFITPWSIRTAGVDAIKNGYTQYTSNKGLKELREEISAYLLNRFNVDYNSEEIIVTAGASEGIDLALRATVDYGDEILIPDPSYVSYAPIVELCGGKAVSVKCEGENGFKLTKENLEKVINKNTKALVFPYPNNPTGAIMEKEWVDKIVPLILEKDLLVIADEIYAELTYGQEHYSIASDERLSGRVVLISGFSKSFAMTGWRIGYVSAKGELLSAMLKIHQYASICASTISQFAALSGLKSGKEDGYIVVKEMRDEYDKRRNFMVKSFNDMGLTCFEPKGAFYVFPCVKSLNLTGDEFATKLLEEQKVAVVPGSAFGLFGKDYVRCSYAYSMKSLITALEKISAFVEQLKKQN